MFGAVAKASSTYCSVAEIWPSVLLHADPSTAFDTAHGAEREHAPILDE
jgi:hypothetical protein